MKKYPRKEFLKLAFLANAALYIKPFSLLAQTNRNDDSSANVLYFNKGDVEYEALRKGFNKRINKYPKIIALAKNTDGVAEAVRYAIKNKLSVAIKSGGHCMEGFSSNNDGMMINLSQMNNTEWRKDDILKIQPGCVLSKLYDTLLPKGRIIPGGSCGTVGIGGLTLGGGYGLLSRKFGLTCDSLLEVTMVDGKGNIINTTNDEELLWACKGGGNGNFGVITEMKFQTHPAPTFMHSYRFRAFKTDTARAKSIMEKWFTITQSLPVSCFSALVISGKTVYILLTSIEKQSPIMAKVIQQLAAITDKNTHSEPKPLAQALKVFYAEDEPIFFKNASAGLYKSFDDIKAFIDQALEIVRNTPGMIYQVNTLGGNIQNTALESASSFPHRACNYFSELQAYWQTEKQGQRFIDKFETVQGIFNKNGIATQYRNYPDINFKNWESLYYGNNYARLQKVKAKYDPDNLFRFEQSVKA